MKTRKLLLVLLPLLAFVFVACGDFFGDEEVLEDTEQDVMDNDFMIEMDEDPADIYDETWDEQEVWEEIETSDAEMEMQDEAPEVVQ